MLLNVGSGGGAAAPAAGGASGGGAAAGGAAAEETKEEEKEEGQHINNNTRRLRYTDSDYREGGVGRGHGLRSLRLSAQSRNSHRSCLALNYRTVSPDAHSAHVVTDGWKRAILGKDGPARAQRLIAKTDADYEACSETISMTVLYNSKKRSWEPPKSLSLLCFCSYSLVSMIVATPRPMLMPMSIRLHPRHPYIPLLSLNDHVQNLHNLPLLRNLNRICLNPMIL